MSRKAEHTFITTDAGEILAWMTDKYEEITGVTVQPGSPEQLFICWAAAVVVQERVLTNYAANQNLPSRAEGENLDALAELFFTQSRPEAEAATVTMRFTISQAQTFPVTIPGGTRVTDASRTYLWETTADVLIPAGQTTAEATAVCQTAGKAANGFVEGQINSIVDLYPYHQNCENITVSGGGSDAPTDEEFYELLRQSFDAYSSAGARGAYVYFAKLASTEIADVLAASPEPCVVKLYALMKDGTIANAETKAKILEECSQETVRPLGDRVSVEDPEQVRYDVDITVYMPEQARTGAAGETIMQRVREAVSAYNAWQCGKLGRDINPSQLTLLLMQTGIKRVAVTSPVFTSLSNGDSEHPPQVGLTRNVTINNGGYEYE